MIDRLSAVALALAAGSGLAILGAHPPLGAWPLTFVAPGLFLAALWVEQRAATNASRPPRMFRLGALSGVATFAPMLSWLIMPAGYVGWGLLVGVQVVWFGLLAVLTRPFLHSRFLPVWLAIGWTGIDAWRAAIPLNGFEWGSIAYAHVDGSWLLSVARVLGGRGITFLVVLISASAALVISAMWRAAKEKQEDPKQSQAAPVGSPGSTNDRKERQNGEVPTTLMEKRLKAANVPIAMLVIGMLASILITVEPPDQSGSLDVLAVQGNGLRHWEEGHNDPDPPLRITTALRDETLAAIEADGQPDVTIWPESGIDRDPFSDRGAPLAELADETAQAAGTLLAGVTLDADDAASQRYVGALQLEGGLNEQDRYIKRRLVPFGEFIPLRGLLEWFPPLEQVPRDAIPGERPQVFQLPNGVRAAAIICFETMFTDIVRTNILADQEPAQIVLTMTNDASFGDSAEPQQHLAQSQLRAVETGRWVVHGALSGSSAFVDPHGQLSQTTDIFTVDSIRADVPLVEGSTPYLVIGDVVGMVTRVVSGLMLVFALYAVWSARRGAKREQEPR